jgi:hypothetical protein
VNDDGDLRARRTAMYRSWAKFKSGEAVAGVRGDVLSSWRRTRKVLSADIAAAPSGQTELNHEALLASTRTSGRGSPRTDRGGHRGSAMSLGGANRRVQPTADQR